MSNNTKFMFDHSKDTDCGDIICPACGSDNIDYVDESWKATTNTEILYYECLGCHMKFTVHTEYKPVARKYWW